LEANRRTVSARRKPLQKPQPESSSSDTETEVETQNYRKMSKWENYANMTNPTVIQNFTTPSKLLNDQNFMSEFEGRLSEVFVHAIKDFDQRDQGTEFN